jgi:anaerobic selenocysteine-containing dehydrogenase
MELNRRNFIKFVVGGAAGIQLTPLPWKFTDDIAIWTQNWPWVPVPPVGEFTHVKSICTLCPGGCGIKVRKVDNRAVKIEGRTDYPVNPGGLCPLGMGGLQLLYNESIRFTGPMKRVGPRGSGKFIGITWDEALDLLAGRITTLRKKSSTQGLAAVDGNPIRSTMSLLIERLTKAVGSPNYVRTPTIEDTFDMASLLMQGTNGPMAYDLENSDYILSFGSGLLEGWGSPGRIINAWSLWHANPADKKVKIVQIESRASNTASKADQWLAARPGTEAAMALGLCNVIIKEGLYDTEFVNDHCFGFNDWSSADGKKDHIGFKTMVLDRYSPEKVGRITGLASSDIVTLAKEFAEAKAPVAICGKGKGGVNGSLYEFMAVNSLNALAGNINRPGGVLVCDPLPLKSLPEVELDEIALQGLKKPRFDLAGSVKHPFTQSLINDFARAIIDGPKSPVDTLLVFSANPVHTIPDGGSFRKALKKIPFIASFSPFQDETAYMADLILPDHTYLEKMEDFAWPSGLQYPLFGLSRQVVEPIYNTRHTGDVLLDMAKRIGASVGSAFPWNRFEEVLKERVKGLFDSSKGLVEHDNSSPVWQRQKEGGEISPDYESFEKMWGKIKSTGLWHRPVHTYKNWETLFKTPTGKFEFFSSKIELAFNTISQNTSPDTALRDMAISSKGDEAFMPHYETTTHDVDRSEYPLFMVPYEMINLASGWVPNPPFLNKSLFDTQLRGDESFFEINPETAADYKLKQGDRTIIKSPSGQITARANLSECAMPGYVYMPLGFGHTAYDEFMKGKGVNPNEIIYAGKDPLSGLPVWWNTPVRILKA